jgi:hypothetical protein
MFLDRLVLDKEKRASTRQGEEGGFPPRVQTELNITFLSLQGESE